MATRKAAATTRKTTKPKAQTPTSSKKAQATAKRSSNVKTVEAKTPVPFTSTGYWLIKSEPEAYSIDDFERDGATLWTGVRNYQARNFMMNSMKPGDRILFYHSNAEPSAIVGVGDVLKPNRPDPTAWDSANEYHDPKSSPDHPIWFCAEVGFKGRLKTPLALSELKTEPALAKMALLQKGQRLSVQPVTKSEFDFILKKSGGLK